MTDPARSISCRSARPHLVFAIAAILLCFVNGTALADSDSAFDKPKDPQALEHLTTGNKKYKIQEFEAALAEYKAGALVEAAPLFDYNIGQCYRMLGRYKEAIWQYERFLRYGQPTDQVVVANVNDWLKQMRGELDRKAMTLSPTEPAPGGAPTTLAVVPPSDPWYDDALGWGLAGAGTVALGAAGYFLWDASSLSDQADREPDQMRRHDLQNQSNTRKTVGIVIGIGGLGLLATGVVKLAIHPSASNARTVATTWSLGLSSDGAFVAGRF